MNAVLILRKSGRCANGSERDGGVRWHAVSVEPTSVRPEGGLWCETWDHALCGTKPGAGGNGWSIYPGEAVTCPRCLARLVKADKPRQESPAQAALRWWDAVRCAPALPAGCMTEPLPRTSPWQADLFGAPAGARIISPAEAREVRLTATVRQVALTMSGFKAKTVTIDFSQAWDGIRLAGGHKVAAGTARAAIRVLLARGFLRVEHRGGGEPHTYTLVTR